MLPVVVLAVAAVAVILVVAVVAFRTYREGFLAQRHAQLMAVADLKVAQVAQWRRERLSDAHVFIENTAFQALAGDVLGDADPEAEIRLRSWLRSVRTAYGYTRVVVLDAGGEEWVAVPDEPFPHHQALADTTAAILMAGRPAFLELHRDFSEGPIHFAVVAPIAPDGRPLGAVALWVDAGQELFAMLQRWPVARETAEILLVRADGDEVVFLNELRFQEDAALRLRLPVTREAPFPAGLAVRGVQGIVEGVDYRGEPVVAALRPVPGTAWFLVAKMDRHEVLALVRERLRWTSALAGMLLLGLAGLTGWGWQRREKDYYRSLAEAEARRAAGEIRHRATLESIGDAVVVTDAAGTVELLNPVAEELTGWTEEEAVGGPLREVFRILNEETREPAEDPVARVLREGHVVGLANHTLLVARDGTERPVADSGAPIRDETGELTGVVLVFRDQTAEREAERTLRASEARYRGLFESSRDAILVTDTERNIVDCNPAFTELFGYELDEIRGLKTGTVYADEAEYKAMGEALRTQVEERGFLMTVHYRTKDDRVFAGETTAFFLRDREGDVRGFVGLIRDITRQLEVETELRESERRYRRLFEEAPVGIFTTTSTGQALVANDTMADILGFASGAEAVEHYSDLATQLYADPARRAEAMQELRECGELTGFVFQAVARDGRTLWLEFDARIAEWRDDSTFVLEGFAWDVTERVQAEEKEARLQAQLVQAQKMESVGRLAGGVAHDFNNMLAVILGNTELAMMELEQDDPLYGELEEIRSAATRSSDLTSQLLAFARKQTIAPRVLNLNDTLEGMLKMLRRLIGEDIDLVWRPADELWPVRVDPAQIDQALANLVVNARDAIEDVGKVTIETENVRVSADYAEGLLDAVPGEYVVLAVSDDGCGMDEAALAQLFDPFFTTKPRDEGTGLGLATVYGIVRQNEGFINVYSEVGEGTTFKIYFPRHAGDEVSAEEEVEARAPRGGSETILLVEDELSVLELTTRMLERIGYTVLPAGSPGEALGLAREHPGEIHLLLTDIVMPEMNGRELARELASLHPGIVILFMSGYTANVIAHRGILDEGVHLLQKPFSAADLATEVRKVLDQAG